MELLVGIRLDGTYGIDASRDATMWSPPRTKEKKEMVLNRSECSEVYRVSSRQLRDSR